MSSEPRRHHLLPRWYLKRFATGKDILGVLDLGAQKRYLASVRKAGAEVGFYDVEVDGVPRDAVEQLLGRVEAPASGATMKLTNGGPTSLSTKERTAVALFIATQFLRGANRRDFADAITDAIAKAHLVGASDSALRDDYKRVASEDFSEEEFLAWRDFIRDTDNYRVREKGAVPQLIVEHAPPYAAFLSLEYSWTVVRFPLPVLVTCDVPVALWRPPGDAPWMGVGMATAHEVRVPLDPSHVLILRSKRASGQARPEGLYVGAGDVYGAVVKGVLGWAYRWVFMHPTNPLFETLEIPPMQEPAEGAKDLIEVARKMRIAFESGWTPGSGPAPTA